MGRAAAGRGSQKGRAPAQNPGQEEPVAAQRRRVEADLQEQPAGSLEAEVLGDVRPERMGALGLPLQVQPREREAVHVRQRHRRLRATVRRDAQVGLRHHVRDRVRGLPADRDLGLLVDAGGHGREPPEANDDALCYTWTKIDHTSAAGRALVEEYWTADVDGFLEGKLVTDGKLFL